MPTTLSSPEVIKTRARHIAFIHVIVPRPGAAPEGNTEDMKSAIHGAFNELLPALKAQNIEIVGPWFAHHLRKPTETFDFEICLPISSAVAPVGRIQAAITPILDSIQTVYTGPYEGLPTAWQEFMDWIQKNKYETAEHFYEAYSIGPAQSADSSKYETELICPLAKGCFVS